MSGAGTNVGSVEVTITGDAKPVSDAFGKASEKVDDFEEKLKKTSDAAAKVSSRVDELRAKQEQLTRALVAAANAADRDEAKVHALRNELEATTGVLNRLTNAQQVSVAVQQKVHAAQTASTRAVTEATGASRNLGGAVLEASRAFEDMQYGIAGLLNNIPSLVMQLGGTMGLAGVLSLVLVAATQVTKHWPDFGGAADTVIDKATEKTNDLRTEIQGLERDLKALQTGVSAAKITAGEDTKAALIGANDVIKDFPGGRARFDLLMQSTGGDANMLRGYGSYGPGDRDQYVSPELFEKAKAAVSLVESESRRLALIQRTENEQRQQAMDNARIDAEVDVANAAMERERAAGIEQRALAWMQDALKLQNGGNLTSSAFNESGIGVFRPDISLMSPDDTRSSAIGRGIQQDIYAQAELDRLNNPFEGAITVISHAAAATADEIAAMNADFVAAGSAAVDLRDPLERFRDGLASIDWKAVGTDAVAATAAGGFSAGGVVAGSAVGSVIDVATGGASGGLGALLGGIIGGILGKLLDELIEVLGVLTPVFDALALVISALSPIFMVVGVLLESVAGVIVSLVPILAAVAEPVAALLLVVVRIVEALLPFVSIVLIAAGAIVAWLEVLTIGVSWLDENFFRPLVSGARAVFNGFVDLYNSIIYLVRRIPGFEDFGVTMEGMSTYVEDTIGGFATSLDEIRGVMGDTADATRDAGNSMSTNLPSGYRVPLYEAESPNGRGSTRRTTIIINGGITLQPTTPDLARALREGVMAARGRNVWQSGGEDDDTN